MDGEMPVTVERASIPAIPRRRAHHEVIDVDELDDEQQVQRPSQRPRRPVPLGDSSRNSVSSDIIILDSDDGSGPGPSTGRRPARLRSPPPPAQIIYSPPPVPRLISHPRSLNQPHVPPDVVRPNPEPFAFERTLMPPMMRPASHPPPGDALPPRHRPVINLGGGFVSSNHQLEGELIRRQQARDRARQRYFEHLRIARGIHQRHGFLSQTLGRIFPSWLFGDPTEDEMMDALAFSELATADVGPFGFGDDRAQLRRTTHEYRVAYTHPYPPAPGFTHDFESPSPSVTIIDVDEEPGPSSKASGSSSPIKNNENLNTLVCARCLDPLVLGGSSMSEDERSRHRLWGLRCGHMLDGKCIAELMKPRPAPDLEPTGTEVAGIELPSSGLQGQSSSTQSQDGAQSMVFGDAIPPDGKYPARFTNARGKARAVEQPSQLSQPAEVAVDQTTFAGNNSIRARLRPRNNTGNLSRSSSQRSPTIGNRSIVANTHHHSRRRARGKGKQKAMEPVILERHEWRCPVALCERLHLSLHIESRGWVMDETQGAIPIFA
ncbi:hypothetical protein DFH94DRAFT_153014 [Russula ochroleuca]|jgi:hypothetical protein|uniref:Uncharacterized protein n=1 Tax=Russula ochroleuca TaxID=152965 RepID=A0A9P5N3W5_9AGAM|nr:hypothetical protein DFH94DRAFT_153014 [Russula ochroleuca]